ncbi:hypothetical protein [Streptosporangium amethystogenes]|uniref:hypothetical protein n=1 Tax=Streptosporangium amethystogenes TaxID=2002 RepID=UPI0012F85624|nr:hypothetical protein [Streptosporangium amethystogenes]
MTRIGRSPIRDRFTGESDGFGGLSTTIFGNSDVSASAVTYVGAGPVSRVP